MKYLLIVLSIMFLLLSCSQTENKIAVKSSNWKGLKVSKLDLHSKLKSGKKSVTFRDDGTEEVLYRFEKDDSTAVKCDGVICSVDDNPKVCNVVFTVKNGLIVDQKLEGRCEDFGEVNPEN